MRVAAVAFTRRGLDLARRIAHALEADGCEVELSAPERFVVGEDVRVLDDLASWVARAFPRAEALLFVSATGIAVRAIAPYVADKMRDPAVVCIDEAGGVAIPLLSGHVGGANRLARRVADICGGAAAISTATDVNHVFAVDEWAREQDLALVEREGAKRVSAALLEGMRVGISSDFTLAGTLPEGLVAGREAQGLELGICISYDASGRPFADTLHLVPRTVVAGIGCRRDTPVEKIAALVRRCLEEAHVAPAALVAVASIDVKADEPGLRAFAEQCGCELRLYGAEQLKAVPGDFSSSEFVLQTVGVDNVCERAACAGGQTLLLSKRSADGVTVALGASRPHLALPGSSEAGPAMLACVGLGPGGADDMTLRARKALDAADLIVGYTTYIDLIRDAYPHKELLATPMRREVERCRMALERAQEGRRVAMVCSGDPGVYGMAGLLLELAEEYEGVAVEVIPGVSAANGGAAVLGAPLMHDWCTISLSDLMTPWELIERRLAAAAQADFCISLYNPASRHRPDHLRRACDILLAHRSPETVCGYVRNIGREGEERRTLTLGELRDAHVDMFTCVFVGNSQTRVVDGRMVTPRGYGKGGA